MTDESQLPGDRRKPIARYVQFGDEEVQGEFITAAERVFQSFIAADTFEGIGEIELRTGPAPAKKGLFRKAVPAPAELVPVTAALAKVAHLTTDVPRLLTMSPQGCAASRRVAQILSSVATDLVRDLLKLDPAAQPEHPAYRQTLRLGAELEALHDTMTTRGCTDPAGCVGVRSPEAYGRRLEDVEVDEVRDVLLQLALAGKADARG